MMTHKFQRYIYRYLLSVYDMYDVRVKNIGLANDE